MLVTGKVSLLHVHSAVLGSFWRKSIFCAFARAFDVPYIFHIHSGYFPVFVRDDCGPLARWWVRHTLRRACCVIALTSSWRAALEELVPGLRVEVLGNPVVVPDIFSAHREKPMHVLFLDDCAIIREFSTWLWQFRAYWRVCPKQSSPLLVTVTKRQ